MTLKSILMCSGILITQSSAQAEEKVQTIKPASASELVASISLPYETFTLKNGLQVVVHSDRKAPIVSVAVWYDVGSKDEPQGSTGFAHLFEHLMFNGTENAPGDFFEPLEQIGATSVNGSTSTDHTSYYETVPTPALERALFLESDRMGHLLGAITQAALDEQRGVVQNEKREGDNQPYGLSGYRTIERLFPAGHPYGHSTIGSMADLDRASLAMVQNWFRDHYGPNNAVLVLAGDIDLPTAKRLAERYFGAIPSGPKNITPDAPVPVLASSIVDTMKDRVAATRITRSWPVPGAQDIEATAALSTAGSVLGGLRSSRLDTILVRDEKLATEVSAGNSASQQVGIFSISVTIRPGVDPTLVTKRLDDIVAGYIATGPSADEIERTTIAGAASQLKWMERPVGQAAILANGALHANDPGLFKKQLLANARQTPATVRAALQKWLTRPSYTLTIVPGAREAYDEAKVPAKVAVTDAPAAIAPGTRGPLPPVGKISDLNFPPIIRDRLSNGIGVAYVQWPGAPLTRVAVSFDAGIAADVPDKLGTQNLTLAMIEEGSTSLNGVRLAQARERLGVAINTQASPDATMVTVEMPSANLQPGIGLFADMVRNPAFAEAEVARVKTLKLAEIDQELTDPAGLAYRVWPRLIDANSPYSKQRGAGDRSAVANLGRADLIAFQQNWLRSDKASIYVVSDRPLAEVKAALERGFGDWRSIGAPGVKDFSKPPRPSPPKIVLVDRPDSPQSYIMGVDSNGLKGTFDDLSLRTANDALGGSFLGRINMDLRETRHWAYGASGGFWRNLHAMPYVVSASVQQDKTGESIAALQQDIREYLTSKPMTRAEFDRAIDSTTRSMVGNFDTGAMVLYSLRELDLYKRPDDYFATLTRRYRALSPDQVRDDIRRVLNPTRFTWVVVGEAAKVKPQLDALGLPIEVWSAQDVAEGR